MERIKRIRKDIIKIKYLYRTSKKSYLQTLINQHKSKNTTQFSTSLVLEKDTQHHQSSREDFSDDHPRSSDADQRPASSKSSNYEQVLEEDTTNKQIYYSSEQPIENLYTNEQPIDNTSIQFHQNDYHQVINNYVNIPIANPHYYYPIYYLRFMPNQI